MNKKQKEAFLLLDDTRNIDFNDQLLSYSEFIEELKCFQEILQKELGKKYTILCKKMKIDNCGSILYKVCIRRKFLFYYHYFNKLDLEFFIFGKKQYCYKKSTFLDSVLKIKNILEKKKYKNIYFNKITI